MKGSDFTKRCRIEKRASKFNVIQNVDRLAEVEGWVAEEGWW